MNKIGILLLALVISSCATAPPQTPRSISAGEVYRHPNTHMEFPRQVGGFLRKQVEVFNVVGDDVGVHYSHLSTERPILISIYNYPNSEYAELAKAIDAVVVKSKESFEADFERLKGIVLKTHKDAALKSEEDYSIGQNGVVYTGKIASFEYEQLFAGLRQRVESHLILVSIRGYYYKYRVTYPVGVGADGDIKEFLESLVLPPK